MKYSFINELFWNLTSRLNPERVDKFVEYQEKQNQRLYLKRQHLRHKKKLDELKWKEKIFKEKPRSNQAKSSSFFQIHCSRVFPYKLNWKDSVEKKDENRGFCCFQSVFKLQGGKGEENCWKNQLFSSVLFSFMSWNLSLLIRK